MPLLQPAEITACTKLSSFAARRRFTTLRRCTGDHIEESFDWQHLMQHCVPDNQNACGASIQTIGLSTSLTNRPMLLRHKHFGRRNVLGFSLVELMVSVAILSILAALAAPSFSDSIKRYRITAIREDLGASIQLARAEAIRRGLPVVLIRELTCSVALVDTNDWSCGWRMVQDTNADGAISTAERDVTLKTTTVPVGYRVNHPNLGNSMTFGIWGQATVAQQRFVIAPPEGTSGASTTAVCISSGGRLTTSKKDTTCLTT